MLRVGCLDYINALPFSLPLQRHNRGLFFSTPNKLNYLLRSGGLDASLISSIESLNGDYQLLPSFGIAGSKTILSVNFYIQFPLASLSGMRVGVTPHSATSTVLLKILCRHFWNIEPVFEPLNHQEGFSNYAALLLIGDEALQNLTIPQFKTIDLCATWHAMTGLPFVFAVFAARKEVDPHKIEKLKNLLDKSLQWSELHREFIEQEAVKKSSLPPQLVHQYYNVLRHRLGEKEFEGVKLFNELKNNVSEICS